MKKKSILLIVIFLIFVASLCLFLLFQKEKGKEARPRDEKKEEIIKLNKEQVKFKTYRVNQKFYLEIPELFVQMSDEETNKRYTNAFKPGLIFTDDTMLINLLVHAANDALSNDTLQTFLENYKATLQGASITKEEITTKENKNIARIDYIVQNDTSEEFHHILFFEMEGKAVMIDFKYPKSVAKNWDKICNYTLNSLKFSI